MVLSRKYHLTSEFQKNIMDSTLRTNERNYLIIMSNTRNQGDVRTVNIIISVVIFSLTAYIRTKYRPQGRISNRMFLLSLVMGAAAAFSSPNFSGIWMSVTTLICIAGYAIVIALYAVDSRKQKRAQAAKIPPKGSAISKPAYRVVRLRGGRTHEMDHKELGYAG